MKTLINIKNIFLLVLFFALIYFVNYSLTDSNKIIKLGSSLPLSGITKEIGTSVRTGANVYFMYANDKKILEDYKIEFICYDDQYEPELTGENLDKLLYEDKVFSLFSFVGTPTIKSILPLLDDHDTPFIAPLSGASFLRHNQRENFINFRAGYDEETEKILKYLIYKKGLSKISIFYQSDDYGDAGYVATIIALKKRKLKLVSEGTYKRNTLSIRQALVSISSAKPEAIIMVGSYKPVALFIKKYRELGMDDTLFCNLSFVNADALVSELAFETDNIIFSQIVPSYLDTTIPVIAEYQKLMEQYAKGVRFGFVSLEAFLTAKITVHALSKISDKDDKKAFIKELKTLDFDVLGGIPLAYKNKQLSKNVYLFEYNDSKFIPLTENSFE